MIIHCLEKEETARKILSPEDITDTDSDNGIFSVHGKSGYTHTVDFGSQAGKPSCTCQDWARNNIPCKHFFCVFINKGGWGWSSLPQSYLKNPYLCCDSMSLANFKDPTGNSLTKSQPGYGTDLFPDDLQEFSHTLPSKVQVLHVCTYQCLVT